MGWGWGGMGWGGVVHLQRPACFHPLSQGLVGKRFRYKRVGAGVWMVSGVLGGVLEGSSHSTPAPMCPSSLQGSKKIISKGLE